MGEFSLSHLLVIGVIMLIFFRKDQLPSLGKSIGKAIRGFKEGLSEIDVNAKDIHDEAKRQIADPQKTSGISKASTPSTESTAEVKTDKTKQEH